MPFENTAAAAALDDCIGRSNCLWSMKNGCWMDAQKPAPVTVIKWPAAAESPLLRFRFILV
jgi:hypothetical protein